MQMEGLLQQDTLDWGMQRGGGGGTRLVLIHCHCASVASARSMLVRAAILCRGSIVPDLNQSRNGSTRWVIPMTSYFSCIICHAVASARKGDTISGWTRERGDRDDQGT